MTRVPRPRRTTCRVCTHIAREEIDRVLVAGQSPHQVARQYADLHEDSVYRHRKNHLSPALQQVAAEVQEQKAVALLDQVRRQLRRVERIATAAERSGNGRMVLDAVREMRGLLELLGKASGELKDGPQVSINVLATPEWVRVRAVLFEALEAHPEARQQVATRLLALEGGPPGPARIVGGGGA